MNDDELLQHPDLYKSPDIVVIHNEISRRLLMEQYNTEPVIDRTFLGVLNSAWILAAIGGAALLSNKKNKKKNEVTT